MDKKNEMKHLADEEISDVSGGSGQLEWDGDGNWQYYFVCSYCLGTKEYIGSGNFTTDLPHTVEGVFECPKCGWKRNFKLRVGNGNFDEENWPAD